MLDMMKYFIIYTHVLFYISLTYVVVKHEILFYFLSYLFQHLLSFIFNSFYFQPIRDLPNHKPILKYEFHISPTITLISMHD